MGRKRLLFPNVAPYLKWVGEERRVRRSEEKVMNPWLT